MKMDPDTEIIQWLKFKNEFLKKYNWIESNPSENVRAYFLINSIKS
jgi:hypothetical protein